MKKSNWNKVAPRPRVPAGQSDFFKWLRKQKQKHEVRHVRFLADDLEFQAKYPDSDIVPYKARKFKVPVGGELKDLQKFLKDVGAEVAFTKALNMAYKEWTEKTGAKSVFI